jgi:uncharacterized protein (DUF4415 family)
MMAKRQKTFKPGQGFSRKDWDDVDSPELSDDQIAKARPFAQALPGFAATIRRGRGPNKAPTKKLVSLRLSPDVLDHFRAKGPGWQSKIDDALRKAAGLKR